MHSDIAAVNHCIQIKFKEQLLSVRTARAGAVQPQSCCCGDEQSWPCWSSPGRDFVFGFAASVTELITPC